MDSAETGRFKTTEELNGIVRRLKQGKTEADWCAAVLDGAARFVSSVALFVLQSDVLVVKGTRGFTLPPDCPVPLAQAAAFRNARESGELVLALGAKSEVSETIAQALPFNRVFVIPISNGLRVAAFLLASAAEPGDSHVLELIAEMASFVLERRAQTSSSHIQIAPVAVAQKSVEMPARESEDELSFLENLSDDEKLQHVRARRLARTKVAELQLYRPEACEAGRAEKNLYLFLKPEIDAAREVFRTQFMNDRAMADYIHLELCRQLAHDNDVLLGADYPGQMY